MELTQTDAALAAMCITTTISTFAAMLPELSQIRAATPEVHRAFVADVRYAEVISSAIVISSCFLITLFSRNQAPVIIGGAACLSMVAMYEITLTRIPGDAT